jgi:hypothetical protein
MGFNKRKLEDHAGMLQKRKQPLAGRLIRRSLPMRSG